MITAAVDPVWHDVREVQASVTNLAQANVVHDDRIGKLESDFQKFRLGAPSGDASSSNRGGDDPGFRRISFLGISNEKSVDPLDRLHEIETFIRTHVPHIHLQKIDNYYFGSFKDKTRTLTKSAYAEFASSDVRDYVLEKLNKHTFSFKGSNVSIRKGLSKSALARNGAIKDAFKLLEKDSRCLGKTVKKEWRDNRGVSVDGKNMFSQGSDGLGTFVAPFTDLQLPTRPR